MEVTVPTTTIMAHHHHDHCDDYYCLTTTTTTTTRARRWRRHRDYHNTGKSTCSSFFWVGLLLLLLLCIPAASSVSDDPSSDLPRRRQRRQLQQLPTTTSPFNNNNNNNNNNNTVLLNNNQTDNDNINDDNNATVDEVVVDVTPVNDVCVNAILLADPWNDSELGRTQMPLLLQGTTVGATQDGTAACGSATAQTSPGVWYRVVVVANDTALQASTTCGINNNQTTVLAPPTLVDTQIKVFTTASSSRPTTDDDDNNNNNTMDHDCDALVCVAGNDDDDHPLDSNNNNNNGATFFCAERGYSAVRWMALANQTYYLLVDGFAPDAVGSFLLQLDVFSLAPANDGCTDATWLVPDQVVAGVSTEWALTDNMPACGEATVQTSPGVWYRVRGTGSMARVSTCVENNNNNMRPPTLDTQIKVYTAAAASGGTLSCDALECIAGQDDIDDNENCQGATTVEWPTVEGQEYLVLVHGFHDDEVGSFDLVLTTNETPPPPTLAPEIPPNDFCENAVGPLERGVVVPGTTAGATNDETENCGSVDAQSSPGVWYTFVGNGNTTKISTTCRGGDMSPDAFDTQIKVYAGGGNNCENLTCVAGNDDDFAGDCPTASGAVVATTDQEIYYVLVHGVDASSVGAFGIVLQDDDDDDERPTLPPLVVAAPPNDSCDMADGPLLVGELVEGSTKGAIVNNSIAAPECGAASTQMAPGVWFTTIGTGDGIIASTCSNDGRLSVEDDFSRQISVFRGDCQNLKCVAGDTSDPFHDCFGEAGVFWQSVANETYYILVHGRFEFGVGDFVLRLHDVPANNVCQNASALSIDTIVSGNTSFASADNVSECGLATEPTSGGVWFTLQVEAEQSLLATTCTGNPDHDGDFRSQISIFRGDCDDSLECVAGNGEDERDGCYGEAGVTWTASPEETYHILVHGLNENQRGTFHLVVRESTLAPTLAPTGIPSNDDCEAAIGPLSLGSILRGSTLTAATDDTPQCDGTMNHSSAGVWYTVVGTGETIKVSTCTGYDAVDFKFDSQISVYRNGCTALECVTGNDDDTADECGLASSAVWDSTPNELYHVLVHGTDTAAGPFVLSVREAPSNDFCEKAAGPLMLGSVIQGTTSGASFDSVSICGSAGAPSAPGVWYAVEGTGASLYATTCVQNATSTFDTQISVFQGDCGDLECVNGNDDDLFDVCPRGEAGVLWMTDVGVTYLIFVHGFGLATGDFSLVVRETSNAPTMAPTEVPRNEICEDAVGPLEIGKVVVGSTIGKVIDNTAICGGASEQLSGGLWFKVIGDGTTFKASTCHGDPDIGDSRFDTQLKVFRGNCSALECIDGNDDDDTDSCGTESGVIWTTTEGEDYFILVHGFGEDEGPFGLVVTETTPPPTAAPVPNDLCTEATTLELDEIVDGALDGATNDEVSECGAATAQVAPGLWYTIEPEEDHALMATLCTGNPDHDTDLKTQISVFQGGCDLLECIAGNDDFLDDVCPGEAGVVWDARANVSYHVLVHGLTFAEDEGSFHLVVRETTNVATPAPTGVPLNDACDDSIGPLAVGSLIDGSTYGATSDTIARCGNTTNQTIPGVWYSVVGTGSTIKASTCSGYEKFDEAFDSQISVFRGDDCGMLECVVEGGDDQAEDCNGAASVVWDSVVSELYRVLVHGTEATPSGRFVLSIRETPSNDFCDNASPLTIGSISSGTTSGGSDEGLPFCGLADNQSSSGVWYTVVGRGGSLLASTCTGDDSDIDFSTQISLFEGDCEDLVCVDGMASGDPNFACVDQPGPRWFAADNVTYHILVHGVGSQTGSFNLVVEETTNPPTMAPTLPPPNDNCEDATGPLELDQAIEGSTVGTTDDGTDICGTALPQGIGGVWYTFLGTGSPVKATTCHEDPVIGDSDFDTQLKVFRGADCSRLECVDGNDDDIADICDTESSVSWFAEDGELYRLLVHGFGANTGQFGIVVRGQVNETVV